jgi:hypothetical protein
LPPSARRTRFGTANPYASAGPDGSTDPDGSTVDGDTSSPTAAAGSTAANLASPLGQALQAYASTMTGGGMAGSMFA